MSSYRDASINERNNCNNKLEKQNDGNLHSFGLFGGLDHPSSVGTASLWGEDLTERRLRAEFGSHTCERTETPRQGWRVHQPRFE